VLTTSSGAVYGKQPSELTHVPETYLGAPDVMDSATTTAYAEGKRVSELLGVVAGKQYGFEFISARCFAFMGAFLPLNAHFAAGNFVRDALTGGPIVIGGDGTPQRSYLYAGDLVVWLMTMLIRGVGGRAYNVGSDESVSIKTLAQRIAAPLGCSVEVKQAADPTKPIARYVPNIDRARSELGLDVFTSLDDSIARMLTTLRQGKKV
jgi:dTDP-glucose 4,6-dehydratase